MSYQKSLLIIFLSIGASLYAMPGYFEPWGKDADLKIPVHVEAASQKKHSLAVKIFEQVIRFHQTVISPVDGPRSHFKPSSSQYMLLAIRQHGFLKGYIMGCDRLLRENEEKWVYRTTLSEGKLFKWDPPPQ